MISRYQVQKSIFYRDFYVFVGKKKITVCRSNKKGKAMSRILIINFGSSIDQLTNYFCMTCKYTPIITHSCLKKQIIFVKYSINIYHFLMQESEAYDHHHLSDQLWDFSWISWLSLEWWSQPHSSDLKNIIIIIIVSLCTKWKHGDLLVEERSMETVRRVVAQLKSDM